jgi:hypothetical protein
LAVLGVVAIGLTTAPRAAAGGTSLTISVTLTGNGSGYYDADGGIHCVRGGGITSGTCQKTYDLSGGAIPWGNAYAPDPGSCYVAGDTCQEGGLALAGFLYPGPDQFVSMEFRLLDPVRITVKKTGTGAGTVKSTPRGISCGSDCKSDYAKSSTFSLKATPSSGSKFTRWSGGPCDGQGVTCTFTVGNGPITITAVFTKSGTATPEPAATALPAPTEGPNVTAGPTPIIPTPFPTFVATVSPTSAPAATGGPPTAPTGDAGGQSTLVLALGSLLVIILAAGALYAMRSGRGSGGPADSIPSPQGPPRTPDSTPRSG